MAAPPAMPKDLVQPGHASPSPAPPGAALQRAGPPEPAADLVRLAGCRAIGVRCETMGPDGSPARPAGVTRFSRKQRLKICTIPHLIQFPRTRGKPVGRREVVKPATG